MHSLKKNNGETINDQPEILNETMQFYKTLYSKKDRNSMDLESLLSNYNVPRLDELDKNKLKGPLTYPELLYCLKKTSNNTSPGFHELTYEFFNFFWKDIGHFLVIKRWTELLENCYLSAIMYI